MTKACWEFPSTWKNSDLFVEIPAARVGNGPRCTCGFPKTRKRLDRLNMCERRELMRVSEIKRAGGAVFRVGGRLPELPLKLQALRQLSEENFEVWRFALS